MYLVFPSSLFSFPILRHHPQNPGAGGATPPHSLWSGLGGVKTNVHVQVPCWLDSTMTLLEKMPGGDAGHWALLAAACVQEPGAQEANLCRAESLQKVQS